MLTILFKKKTCVHADVLYLFFFCFFFKKYRIENIESCYKYCNMYCIVRGAYRFSPNEIKELKEGRKSHNHLSWLGYCKPTFIRVREIIARV